MRKVLLFFACVPLWGQTTPATGQWIGLTPNGYPNQVAGYDGCAYTGSTNNTVLCFDDYNTLGVTSEVQDTMLQFDYPNNRWTLLTNGGRWRSTHRPSGGHQMGVIMYIPGLNSVVWQTNYSFANTVDTYARMYGWDIAGMTGFEMPVPTNGGVITRPWLQNTGGELSETAVDNTTTNRWAIFPDERQGTGDASICTLSAGVLFTCTHVSGGIPALVNFGMAAEGGLAFITNGSSVYTLNFATGAEAGPLTTTCTGADCAGAAPSTRFGMGFAWSSDDHVFMLAGGSTGEGNGSAIIDTWTFNPATNAWTELCGPNLNPTRCSAFSFLPTKPGMRLVYDTHDHLFIWVQPGGAVAIYAIGTAAPLAYGNTYTFNAPPSASLNKTGPLTTTNSTAQGWASDVSIFSSGSNVYIAHTEPAPPSGSGNCIPPIPYVNTAAGAYFPTGSFSAGCSAIGFNTGVGMQIASHTMGTATNGRVWTAFAKERIDNPNGTANSLAFALATTPPSSSSNTWTNPNFPPQAVTAAISAGSNTITLSPFPRGVQNGSILLIQNSFTGPTGTDEYVPVTNVNSAANQITITTKNTHSGMWYIGDSGEVGCFTRACTYATTYKIEQRPASIITIGTAPVMAVIEQDVSTNAHDEYLYVAQYGTVWTQVGTGKVNVYGSGTHVQSATLASDGTNPAICWVEYVDNEGSRSIMTTTPQLYCKQWNGSTWKSMGAGLLNQNSTDYINDPSLTYYNGYFYVAWTERTPNGWPQVLVYSYNGTTWSQVGSGSLNVNTNTGIAYHPVLAADGNSALYVSWEEQSALGQHNLGYVRTWNGTSWVLLSSTVAQDTVNGSIEDLGIVANAGTITAAWSELSAGNLRQLYVAELSEAAELPATLVSLAVTPSNPSLAVGVSQQFTATGTYNTGSTQNLTGSVTWSSSAPGAATINGSGSATGVARGTTTITAASGSVSGSTALTVLAPVLVSTLACAPASLGQSAVSTCTVTLTQTAPAGGSNVTLASNNASLTVPASVLVAVGATTATFSATAAASIASNQSAAVTATLGSSSQTATIGLLAPVLVSTLACAPASLGQSAVSTCTVTLTQTAPVGGSNVTLASNNPLLTVPASVLVAVGATTATFSATAAASIASNQSAAVTATLGSSSQTATIGLLAPVLVSTLACAPASLGQSAVSTCTVTLTQTAPVGGSNVTLASNNASLTVPASVLVAVGATTATFSATAAASIASNQSAAVTATLGSSSQTATIGLLAPVLVSTLACAPASLGQSAVSTCTVTLTQTAPAGGSNVTLASNNASLTVPASVLVAVGAATATFSATAAASIASNQSAAVTATLGSSSQTATIGLLAPVLVSTLACAPASLGQSAVSTCTVTLTQTAPAGGSNVTLASNNASLTVPASVLVAVGAATATFSATAAASIASNQSAAVTATLGSSSQTATIGLLAPVLVSTLACAPASLGQSAVSTCTVTLTQTAPAGGSNVTLASNNASLTVPASVLVAVGATTATFSATAAASIASNQSAAVTATLGSSSQTATIGLLAPVLVSTLACAPAVLGPGGSSNCNVNLTQTVPAISLVRVTSCGPQTFPMSTCTIPATGSGNLIVVGWQSGAGVDTPVTISSVTDDAGNTYAEAGVALSVDSASGSFADVWYAPNSLSGATTLTITPSSNIPNGGAVIWEFSGADVSAPLDQTAVLDSQAASATPAGAAVTTSAGNDVVISLATAGNVTGIYSGSAFTSDSTVEGAGWAHSITSSAGTYAAEWNQSPAGTYASSTVAFRAAGSVTLTSNNPLLTVPASVLVAVGAATATFSATAAASIASNQSAAVTATLGSSSQTATIGLLAPVLVSTLACAPASLGQSAVSTCTVTLTQTAPAGGSNVTLASNNASLTVPASVLVAVGATTATFSATAAASIASNQSAAVTATLGSSSQTATIGLLAPVLVSTLACAPASLGQSAVSTCTVTLTQTAPVGGSNVTLASNNASLTVPASVLVAVGATTATFSATAAASIASNQSAAVTATLGSSSQTATIGLLAPVLVSTLACAPASLGQSAVSTCTVTLTQTAPAGGSNVTLASNNASLTVPASVLVAVGATTATFSATAAASIASNQSAAVTATLGSSSQTATIGLLAPVLVSTLACAPAVLGPGGSSNCNVNLTQTVPAISLVRVTSCGPQTFPMSTCTIPATGSGNLIVVGWQSGAGVDTPVTISSVTDDAGNTYAEAGAALSVDSASGSFADVWYAPNSLSGATTLTITPSSNIPNGGAVIWEFSGADVSAPLDQTAVLDSQAASATPAGAAVTTSAGNDVVISLATAGNVTGIYSGSAFTSDSTVEGAGWAHSITSSAGTYAAEWNQSPAGTYASSTVAFRAAGSVTLTSNNPLLTVPASVLVAVGATTATFSATAAASIASNQSAAVTATLGSSSQTATIGLLAPVLVSTLACAPASLGQSAVSTCTVTLTQTAPAGGSNVTLASNNASLTVPASVLVAVGATTATFSATAAASIASNQSAAVTATLGSSSQTATIGLLAPVLVSTLACAPASLGQSAVSTCTVTLTQTAPVGGSNVTLASNNASLTVPASVLVAVGATTATFSATAAASIASNQSAAVTATLGSSSQTATIGLLAPVLVSTLACAPASLGQSAVSTCTVTLTQTAPAGGSNVTLASNNASLTVPASVLVAVGAATATFSATAAASIASNQSAAVTATLGSSSQTATIGLLAPVLVSTLACAPASLGQSAVSTCTVTLTQTAPAGGSNVTLASNNASLTVPASVLVAVGATTATFSATAAASIASNQSAAVTATLGSSSQTATIGLLAPVLVSTLACAPAVLGPGGSSNCNVNLTQTVPAISLVRVTSCGPQTFPMSTCTIPATGSGNLIVVGWQSGAGVDTPVTISSVTDDAGNTYAEAGVALSVDSASGSFADVWYAPNSLSGATTLTITPSSNIPNGGAVIWEFSGADVSAPLDQTAVLDSQAASATPAGAAVTTSAGNDVVISLATAGNVTGIYSGSAFTSDSTVEGAGWAHSITSSAGTYAAEWNQSPAGTYASSTVAFRAAGSVTLASNNASLTVPASVLVAVGATTATFSATAAASIASNQSAAVTATLGSSSQTATIGLLAPVLVSTLACAPASLGQSAVSTCTVTLTQTAPVGGSNVTLASNNASLTVPASVLVAVGAATATFSATAAASIASNQSAAVTATLGSSSQTATIGLLAPVLVSTLACAPASLGQSAVSTCTVTLTQTAPAGGSNVTLASNNASLTVPASVLVAVGATTATFSATAAASIASNQSAAVTATLGSSSQTATIGLLAPVLVSTLACAPAVLGPGGSSNCNVNLTQTVPAISLVRVTSCGPQTFPMSTCTIPATGSGNLIVVGWQSGAGVDTPVTISSVTDDAGNTYAEAGAALSVDSASGSFADVWYAPNSLSGATTLTITPSSNIPNGGAVIWEFSGADVSAPLDQTAVLDSQAASATPAGAAVTTSAGNDVVISLATAGNVTGIYSGSAFTSDSTVEGAGWAHSITSSAGTYAAEWNQSPAGTYASSTVAFRAAGSVTLTSNNPLLTVPASVLVAVGAATATFSATAAASIASNQSAAVTATLGSSSQTATIGLLAPVLVSTLACAPASLGQSAVSTCTVTLTQTAPVGGSNVTLASNNASLTVPASVLVAVGATTATFSATAAASIASNQSAAVTATLGSSSQTATIGLLAPVLVSTLACAPASLGQSAVSTCTVTLTQTAPAGGSNVTLASNNASLTVPASVLVAVGAATATFSATAAASIASNQSAAVTATLGSSSQTATIGLLAPVLVSTLACAPASLGQSAVSTCTVTLTQTAPAGGSNVTLASNNASLTVPASVLVAVGATTATFSATAAASIASNQSAAVTATLGSSSQTATIGLLAPVLVSTLACAPAVLGPGGSSNCNVNLTQTVPAISLVRVTSCGPQTFPMSTCTIPATGSGNLIVVGWQSGAGVDTPVTISSVTDDAGNTYAEAGVALSVDSASGSFADVWYAPNSLSGATTLTITPSSNIPNGGAVIWEFSGADVSAPLDQTAVLDSQAASATPAGAAVTTSAGNDVVISLATAGNVTGIYSGSAFTSDSTVEGAGWAHSITSSAGTYAAEWNQSPAGTYASSTVAFRAAGSVTLTSNNPLLTVPASVLVAVGATTATFSATAAASIASNQSAAVTATLGSSSQTATIGLLAPVLVSTLACAPASLGQSAVSTCTVTLTQTAPVGGSNVTLASNNASLTVPASVLVAVGATTATFSATAAASIASNQSAAVTATLGSSSQTATIGLLAPVLVSTLACAPASLGQSAVSTCTVTLTQTAPVGGSNVTLASNNASLTVPASVLVAVGATTATFSATAAASIASNQSAAVTATLGSSSQTATIGLLAPVLVSTLACAPASLGQSAVSTCTVTLTQTAPAGGSNVTLASNNASLTVPASVLVAVGAATATFSATAAASIASNQSAAVTATLGSSSQTATIGLLAPVLVSTLACAPAVLGPGGSSNCNVNLTQTVPAISLVRVTSCGPQTFPMSTCTIPATGSGNLIVVGWQSGAGVDTPVTISSVTDDAGNTYAEAGVALSVDSASGSFADVWYAPNSLSGATTLTITPSSNIPNGGAVIWEFSGADVSAPLDQTAVLDSQAASATPAGAAVTTSAGNDVVISLATAGNVTGIYSGSAFTSDSTVEGAGWAHSITSSAGTYAAEWNQSPAGTYASSTVAFRAAGSVTLTSNNPLLTVPASVLVAVGATTATFSATAAASIASNQSAAVTATLGSSSQTATIGLLAPVLVSTLACAPASLGQSAVSTCTVTLTQTAPAGGSNVTLASNNASLTVPASVLVAVGATTATFSATAAASIASNQSAAVTATLGSSSQTATIGLLAPVLVSTLACAPASLGQSAVSTCTVTLTQTAPVGGSNVTLASNNASLTVPASVLVAVGATTATFSATAAASIASNQSAAVTATLGSSSQTATIGLLAPVLVSTLACAPASLGQSAVSTCTVTLTQTAPAGGSNVTLASNNASLTVPASVLVAVGATTATFSATAAASIASNQSAAVTATLGSSSQTATIGLLAPVLVSTLACAPAVLGPGGSSNCNVNLTQTVPAISLVRVTSCGPQTFPMSTCTIPATGSGNLIVVGWQSGAGVDTPVTISSVTDDAGNTYAEAGAALSVDSASGSFADVWYAPNSLSGATTLTITPSSNIPNGGAVIWEFSGADVSAPLDQTAVLDSQAASATPAGAAVTTSAGNDVVISLATAGNVTGIYSGSAFTSDSTVEGAGWAHSITSSAGTYAAEWNQSPAGTYASSTVAFRAAGSVTLTSNNPLLTVPASVLVAVGATTATFSATAAASIASNQSAAVTATLGSSSQTATIGLLAPVLVSTLACAPASLGQSAVSTCTVTLTQTAPAGGSNVTLASNNASLTVPASVLVAVGATTATFSATAAASIASNQSAAVTATLGSSSQTATIGLLAPVLVSTLACAPASLGQSAVSTCTVTLTQTAPVGGSNVTLASNNASLTVPASVLVAVGATTATFSATAAASIASNQSAAVTATLGSSSQTATIGLLAPVLVSTLACAPASLGQSAVSTCTVTLTQTAPAGGSNVTLASNNASLTVPASVLVAVGATTATFSATAAASIASNQSAAVTATLGSSSQTATIGLLAPVLVSTLACAPASLGQSAVSTCTVTLTQTAPAGGSNVTLASNNASLTVPASVLVAVGAATATFSATAAASIASNQSAAVTATLGSSSQTATIGLLAPVLVSTLACAPAVLGPGGSSNCNVNLTQTVPAISLVRVTSCGPQTFPMSTCTIPATGSGNLIVVGWQSGAGVDTPVTISSVTDDAGNTYAEAGAALSVDSASGSFADVWYAPNSLSGATTLTITPSSNIPNGGAVIWEFSGADVSAPLDQTAVLDSQAASATPAGAAVTTSAGNDVVISLATAGNVTGIYSGSAFTSDSTVEGAGWAHSITSSAGTYAAEWNQSPAGTYASSTVAFRAAGSVTLTSNNPLLTVPASVLVAVGAATATFSATAAASIASNQSAAVTATLGSSSQTATIGLLAPVLVSTLACAPASLGQSAVSTCTVTLTQTAPAGGSNVTLASNNASLTVPASVLVAVGATTATFSATAAASIASNQSAAVTATLGSSSQTATIGLLAPVLVSTLACAPASLGQSAVSTCTVTLTQTAPVGGSNVTLASNNASLTVPASVLVAVGATTATFSATAAASIASNQSAAVTATLGSSSQTATIGLLAPVLVSTLACAPASLGQSAVSTCTVTLTQTAPAGGSNVTLASNNASLTVPASVLVAVGAATATFSATAAASIASNQSAAVTATLGSSSQTATIGLLAPVLVSTLACAPASLGQSAVSTCTVTLTQTAPVGGSNVTLASNNASLTVPASVLVAVGATTATFSATAAASIASNQSAAVTATLGSSSQTATIGLLAPVLVSTLACAPASLGQSAVSTCTVTLTQTAPAGGSNVTLASNNASLTVPASVLVAVGATTATFSATAAASIASNQSAAVTATLGSSSQTATIGLLAPVLVSTLACAPASLGQSAVSTCTVTLTQTAPAGGSNVTLASNNASLTVPASVLVAVGATTATFSATAAASIASNQSAAVTATLGSSSQTASITLLSVPVTGLTCSPASFTAPGSVSCTITLSGAAPAGGLSVKLSSGNPQAVVPTSLSIPAGAASASFTATVSLVSASGGAVITASVNSSMQSASIAFISDQVSSVSCGEATITSGSSTSCTVSLVSAASAAGETVTLSSGNPALTVPATVAVASGATTATFTAAATGTLFESVWVTASLNGSSTATLVVVSALQILGNPSEVSGSSNGSIVTPAVTPSGFTGTLVVTGSGLAQFGQVGAGSGVSFLNCCSNTNTAHYKFTGVELGNIFNVNQGQISFYLKSSYSFAQRQATAAAKRYAFDVQDNVATTHHLFYFLTEIYSNSSAAHLTFSYSLGGAAQFYYVPLGTENTLYGNGVILQVTITWTGSTSNLYLNGTLVQSESYTKPVAAWTAGSVFDLGATEYLTDGGYYSSDDLTSAFTVGVPN